MLIQDYSFQSCDHTRTSSIGHCDVQDDHLDTYPVVSLSPALDYILHGQVWKLRLTLCDGSSLVNVVPHHWPGSQSTLLAMICHLNVPSGRIFREIVEELLNRGSLSEVYLSVEGSWAHPIPKGAISVSVALQLLLRTLVKRVLKAGSSASKVEELVTLERLVEQGIAQFMVSEDRMIVAREMVKDDQAAELVGMLNDPLPSLFDLCRHKLIRHLSSVGGSCLKPFDLREKASHLSASALIQKHLSFHLRDWLISHNMWLVCVILKKKLLVCDWCAWYLQKKWLVCSWAAVDQWQCVNVDNCIKNTYYNFMYIVGYILHDVVYRAGINIIITSDHNFSHVCCSAYCLFWSPLGVHLHFQIREMGILHYDNLLENLACLRMLPCSRWTFVCAIYLYSMVEYHVKYLLIGILWFCMYITQTLGGHHNSHCLIVISW